MTSLAQIPNIVPILSGKGGVGKSSVTTQLALSLCLQGFSVGVLDIDLTGPSIPRLFGIEDAKVRQAPGGWLPVQVHDVHKLCSSRSTTNAAGSEHPAEKSQPVKDIGALYVMSLGFLLRSRSDAVIWRGPKKTAMVGQLLSEVLWPSTLDYVLIDTPPGTSDEHISLVTGLLDPVKFPAEPITRRRRNGSTESVERKIGAVIVTTPQAISTADVKKELSFCYKVGLGVYGVIENMAGYVCPCCGEVTNVFSKGGGQVMAKDWGVKFLGSAPIDGEGWGMLVEERAWPIYGKAQVQLPDDSLEGEAPEGEMDGLKVEDSRDEKAPMVEKYTACSLCPVFEDITRQVVGDSPRSVVPPT
jgi:Mrp family chromosome partitioning ATPase